MALTLTRTNWKGTGGARNAGLGDRWLTLTSVAFDNSYPTGGESLTFADLGFSDQPDVVFVVGGHEGYLFDYDYTNQKILVYRFDYDAVADGAAIEVANAVDLSGLNAVIVLAIGKYGA